MLIELLLSCLLFPRRQRDIERRRSLAASRKASGIQLDNVLKRHQLTHHRVVYEYRRRSLVRDILGAVLVIQRAWRRYQHTVARQPESTTAPPPYPPRRGKPAFASASEREKTARTAPVTRSTHRRGPEKAPKRRSHNKSGARRSQPTVGSDASSLSFVDLVSSRKRSS